jgi:4'-phosphopantetheinyl transferase
MTQTQLPSAPLHLPVGHVDVWYTYQEKADLPHLTEAYWQLITAEERTAVERFKLESTQRQALIARALQRWTLSHYAPVDPADWRFGREPRGKPFIQAPSGKFPAFNLSHSSGMIVCAVAWANCIGVDVEGD